MPDPLSIAAGVTSLLVNSYKFSKDMYELIDSVQSAPKHIHSISDDLKALYATLGTLDSLLRDEQIARNTLMRDLSANLEDALKNCVRVFRELGMVVNEYVSADGMAKNGAWTKAKWTFKEKEVGALRDHLATYKATCMMAINTATYVRTIETNNLAQRIQEDTSISSQQTQNTLAFIIRRLEAIEAQRPHRRLADREENIAHVGDEESEYNFRMRRFMVETASVLSSSPQESVVVAESLGRPVSPSLAISLEDGRHDNDNGGGGGGGGDDDDDDAETVVTDIGRQLPEERTVSIPNSTAPPQIKDDDDALSKAAAASKLGQAKQEGRLTSDTDSHRVEATMLAHLEPDEVSRWLFWKRRKARKANEEQRKKEIEENGFNAAYVGNGSETTEEYYGYRGWEAASTYRPATTETQAMFPSDNTGRRGPANPNLYDNHSAIIDAYNDEQNAQKYPSYYSPLQYAILNDEQNAQEYHSSYNSSNQYQGGYNNGYQRTGSAHSYQSREAGDIGIANSQFEEDDDWARGQAGRQGPPAIHIRAPSEQETSVVPYPDEQGRQAQPMPYF